MIAPPDPERGDGPGLPTEADASNSTRYDASSRQDIAGLSPPRRIGIDWGERLDCVTAACPGHPSCPWPAYECIGATS
jgi:hypothetical protein